MVFSGICNRNPDRALCTVTPGKLDVEGLCVFEFVGVELFSFYFFANRRLEGDARWAGFAPERNCLLWILLEPRASLFSSGVNIVFVLFREGSEWVAADQLRSRGARIKFQTSKRACKLLGRISTVIKMQPANENKLRRVSRLFFAKTSL